MVFVCCYCLLFGRKLSGIVWADFDNNVVSNNVVSAEREEFLMVEERSHRDFMKEALLEAEIAAGEGEVPVGALVVRGGEVIARDHNRRERIGDPTAHAELLVLRRAAAAVGDWRLNECTLYVTLEPCPMCAGAIVLARIDLVVFGASDPRAGAAGSRYNILQDGNLNHRVEVIGGVLESECENLLRQFWRTHAEER